MAVATSLGAERSRIRRAAEGDVQVGPRPHRQADKGPQHPLQTQQAIQAVRAFIEQEATRSREYLYPFHRQWYVNISSVLGSQSLHAESIARVLRVNKKVPAHRVQHLSNIQVPIVRSLVGYLARSDPDMQIMAGDLTDPFQVDTAQGAKRWVLDHRYRDCWTRKELEVLDWTVFCALGVTKAVWDPNGGPRMSATDDETGAPLMDPQTGEPLVGKNGKPLLFNTGMAATSVIPGFSWWYNINARNYDELSMTGEQSWMAVNEIERRSPGIIKEFGLVPENQYQDSTGYYERQVMQTVGPSGIYTGLSPENAIHGLKAIQVYIAPYVLDPDFFDGVKDPKDGERYDGEEFYEKGAFAIVAQNMVLEFHPNELLDLEGVMPREDWHPYTLWPCYTVPGRMMPQGIPDNLQSLQAGLNFSISRIREAQRLMGQPKWFIPKGAGITKGDLDAEAGEKVWFNPGVGAPMAWSPAPMPAYVFNLIQLMEHHADRVGSMPPMSRGEAQGQVRSGLGVMALQEQALSQYTPMVRQLSWAKARHTRQLLLRQIQYGEIPVRVPYQIHSGDWEQQMFFAQHMSPDFFIRIKAGTEMPRNKAASMAELDRGVAWGFITPMNPKHAEIVARTMGWDLPPSFDGNEEDNLRQGRYENALLAMGQGEPLTLPVYNHTVHINEHIRFMCSQRYREMSEKDPTLHHRFMEHLGKHYGYLQLQQGGVVFPQAIPPLEDLQAVLPPDQAQALGGQAGLAGGGGGGSQQAGPTNRGPATTGTGVQYGTARGGGSSPQIGPTPDVGAVQQV